MKLFLIPTFSFFLLISNCTTEEIREVKKPVNYEIIYELYLKGDATGALREIENIESNDPDILELAGNIYYDNGNISEAIHYFNRSLLQKKKEFLSLKLVSCYLFLGKKEEALRILIDLNEWNTSEPQYPYLIGILYKQNYDYRNAMIYLSYALNRGFEPKEDIYFQMISLKNLNMDSLLTKEFEKYILEAEAYKQTNDNLNEINRMELEISKKNYKKAISIMENLLKKTPDNQDYISIIADLYYINMQYEESLKSFNKLKKLKGSSLETGLGIVKNLLKMNSPTKALEEIKELERKYKNNSEFHYMLSLYYEYNRDYSRAQNEILQFNSIENGDLEKILKLADLYILRSMPEQALNVYSSLQSRMDSKKLKMRMKLATSHILINDFLLNLSYGNLEKAEELIKKSLEVDLNLKTEFFYGYYLYRRENFSEASIKLNEVYNTYKYYPAVVIRNLAIKEGSLKSLNKEIENPNMDDLTHLGEFYEFIGEYEKAVEIFNGAEFGESGKQSKIRCIFKLAKRELQNGNLERGLEFSQKLRKLNATLEYTELEKKIPIDLFLKSEVFNQTEHGSQRIIYSYKEIFSKSGSAPVLKKLLETYMSYSEIEKALEYLNQNQYLRNPDYLEVIVDFYLKVGYNSLALEISEEVENAYPESAICKMVLGRIKLLENNPDSRYYFQRSLDIDPSYIPAIHGMGIYFYKNKEYDKSESFFKLALVQDGFNVDALYYLALIQYDRGNLDNSRLLLSEILKIKSDDTSALFLKSNIEFQKNNYEDARLSMEKILQKSEQLKYLQFYKKILSKINSKKNLLDQVESKINEKSKNYNFSNEKFSVSSISLHKNVNPILPPIKINNNYLLIGKDSIFFYDERLQKIIWKNDLLKNIKTVKYVGLNDIFLDSINELFRIDIINGNIIWKIELLENLNNEMFVKDYIYYPIIGKNNNYSIYIIDTNGKIINIFEIGKSNKVLLDNIGNIYSIFLSDHSLELKVFNSEGSINIQKTLFLPSKESIIHTKTQENSVLVFTENFVYEFDYKGSLVLKSHNNQLTAYLQEYRENIYFSAKNKQILMFNLENYKFNPSKKSLPLRAGEQNTDSQGLTRETFETLIGEDGKSPNKLNFYGKSILKVKEKTLP